MPYLELIAGFALLVAGGDALVRGAVGAARRLRVSPLLIGLTLVGFGTSTPELVTSLQAALAGSPGIAIGNVVGSNVANILLILGVAAAIRPIAAPGPSMRRDGAMLALATGLCVAAAMSGSIGRVWGGLLVAGLVAYIATAYLAERGAPQEETGEPSRRLPLSLALVAGGIAVTVLGAGLLVGAATTLATQWGVSERVIGLTVVAVGTSLPELAASVAAAMRRQGAMALGNVVGSNIYNVFGILGITALVRPMDVPPAFAGLDVAVLIGSAAALLVLALAVGRVGRIAGWTLLTAYGAYMSWLFLA